MTAIVALVPARAGSKGIPNKNLLDFMGQPLVCLTVSAAVKAEVFSDVYISTDSYEIAAAAQRVGAKFCGLRSPILSDDHSKITDVAIDFLNSTFSEFDIPSWLALLEPTSPLRKIGDLSEMAAQVMGQEEFDALVTFSPVRQHAGFMHSVDAHGYVTKAFGSALSNRQEQPDFMYPNGVAYFVRVTALLEQRTFYPSRTKAHLLPGEQGFEIDEPLDFRIVKTLAQDPSYSWLF